MTSSCCAGKLELRLLGCSVQHLLPTWLLAARNQAVRDPCSAARCPAIIGSDQPEWPDCLSRCESLDWTRQPLGTDHVRIRPGGNCDSGGVQRRCISFRLDDPEEETEDMTSIIRSCPTCIAMDITTYRSDTIPRRAVLPAGPPSASSPQSTGFSRHAYPGDSRGSIRTDGPMADHCLIAPAAAA